MTRLAPAFLVLLALLFFSFASHAAPQLGSAPKPNGLTPIAAQLNQQIQSLIGGTTTGQAQPANNPPPASGDQPQTEEAPPEPEETFGTRALSVVLGFTNLLVQQGSAFAENFADLPQVNDWIEKQSNDTRLSQHWREAGQDILMIGIAYAGAFLLELFLLPLRRHLRHRTPADIMRRITGSLSLLLIELVPVIVFVVAALALLNQFETQRLPRFVVLNVIYAITLNRLVVLLGKFLLEPRSPNLRFLPVSQPQALYIYRWLGFFGFVIVYGYFIVDLARSVHVPVGSINAFRSLLGLTLCVMTIIVIVQKRAYVAVKLRGQLSAAQRDLTPAQSLRLWFARSWHVLAIAYLVIGYLVTALSVPGGFAILLRGTILTSLVFAATGLALYSLNRYEARRNERLPAGPQLHHTVVQIFIRLTIWILAVAGVLTSWGVNIPTLLSTPFGQRISGSLFSIAITVVVLALIYGYVSSSVERHLNRQDKDGQPIPASARMRTLLPMLRNAAFIAFIVVATLVILSEVGINIAPLLAGAGIIGVAVGFGSQTLVKDFLTGLFIVIENTIAIGDVVKIGDHSGVVEAMNVRTLRLRDMDGAIHILPFGEVGQIINMTRDFAYAVFNIGVAYDTDLNHAIDVVRDLGEELRDDPKFRSSIIDPIEILGIDKFADSAIIVLARIRTRPGRQWDVKRAFHLRLKERFDQENITIPFPTSLQLQKSI